MTPGEKQSLLLLLDHCDSAMTAAASQLWNLNRDLALELNRRAGLCRLQIKDLSSPNPSMPLAEVIKLLDGLGNSPTARIDARAWSEKLSQS